MTPENPNGTMFIDYCPVPKKIVYVPMNQTVIEFPRLVGYENKNGIEMPIVVVDRVHLTRTEIIDHRGRGMVRLMGWHAPSRTVVMSGCWSAAVEYLSQERRDLIHRRSTARGGER